MEDRVCPILEKPTPTRSLPFAPPPWELAQCTETDMVFLRNPPDYEALHTDLAWEVTSRAESASRQAARPVAYRISGAVKSFRGRVLKRNKMGVLIRGALKGASSSGPIHLLDVGCGWGGLLDSALQGLPASLRDRCVLSGIEISKELAGIAHERMSERGGRCVHADAVSGVASLAEHSVDVIVMSSFLEHEVQPLTLLRNCRDRLRKPSPGGGGRLHRPQGTELRVAESASARRQVVRLQVARSRQLFHPPNPDPLGRDRRSEGFTHDVARPPSVQRQHVCGAATSLTGQA